MICNTNEKGDIMNNNRQINETNILTDDDFLRCMNYQKIVNRHNSKGEGNGDN